MARKIYPLEIVLRPHGTVELVNAREDILWASDSDDDFKEEFNNEFLTEDDLDDILEFLVDSDIITGTEYDKFDVGEWEMTVECLTEDCKDPEDDDDDGENEDFE